MTQQDLLQATRQLNLQELREFSAQVVAIYQERASGQIPETDTHPELLAAIERVEQRQDLVTFTSEAWNAEYHV